MGSWYNKKLRKGDFPQSQPKKWFRENHWNDELKKMFFGFFIQKLVGYFIFW